MNTLTNLNGKLAFLRSTATESSIFQCISRVKGRPLHAGVEREGEYIRAILIPEASKEHREEWAGHIVARSLCDTGPRPTEGTFPR